MFFLNFTYNSSALVGSAFGAIWENPEGGFIKFAVKRASKQDQSLHMEGKLHVILYFREVCIVYVIENVRTYVVHTTLYMENSVNSFEL